MILNRRFWQHPNTQRLEILGQDPNISWSVLPREICVQSGTDSLGTPVCPCVYLLSVLRFQNSQRNLYWGQTGASYWSDVQYKQLVRCTTSIQCRERTISGNTVEWGQSCCCPYATDTAPASDRIKCWGQPLLIPEISFRINCRVRGFYF
jgi:hypothetical protein